MGLFKKEDELPAMPMPDPNFWDKPVTSEPLDACTLCGTRTVGMLRDEKGNALLCSDCTADAELFAKVVQAKEYIRFKKQLG